MKSLYLTALFGLALLFSQCGNVSDAKSIPECRNIKTTSQCQTCCISNGWDTGSYLITEDTCECRNVD